MPVCLIRDDDELNVPFVKSPIDEYRGTGKLVKKLVKNVERVQSPSCVHRCMGHQMTGSCSCDSRLVQLRQQIDEIDEIMKDYDKDTLVGFGKYKTSKWYMMYDDGYIRGVKSWSDWYLKNCTNKGKFYEYLILLKQRMEICDDIRYIRNPNFD